MAGASQTSRRGVLLGLAALAPTGVATALARGAQAKDLPMPLRDGGAPVAASAMDVIPCEGAHQAG
ncbi:MAG: deferrochelatase/peroxidase EfeB, partial [Rhodobacteraceae bacterium]|nr:deferrochelatase/peroxidase EfeB [Paracoccaceae bacterium]